MSVVPYDPVWPHLFALERSRVEAVAGPWVETVEHIGSTAVPGLDAKPVIDLLVSVRNIRDADHCVR
ncbi:MAG: GrpB family protein, partial [Rubrobacteraceae bacterium]